MPELPPEYIREVAAAKSRRAAGSDTSMISAWACVLIGFFIAYFALGGAIWSLWMSRDDSRFIYPAALGFGILALHLFA